jgi:hypothetical protein
LTTETVFKKNFKKCISEDLTVRLESEYVSAFESGRWNRRLEIGNGEYVAMHSESIIVHFPSTKSSLSGSLDDWGQVQPPTVSSREIIYLRYPKKTHNILLFAIL